MTVTTTKLEYQEKSVSLETNHNIYFGDVCKALTRLKKKENKVHFVVTSPPYWNIKNYGDNKQIGYSNTLNDYFDNLDKVWNDCIELLHPGCKMAINIGDQFLRSKNNLEDFKQVYQIIPIHSTIINRIMSKHSDSVVYLGSISWSKVTTSNTSGGGRIMGTPYHPRNGYFFINREYIALFKKVGKDPAPINQIYKELSRFTLEQRRKWFKDTWVFPGERQAVHQAMFPEELPYRLIRMYSFVGDTILDPFLGSGTTSKVAASLGRNSIGCEIGFTPPEGETRKWRKIIKEKVENYKQHSSLDDIEISAIFHYKR